MNFLYQKFWLMHVKRRWAERKANAFLPSCPSFKFCQIVIQVNIDVAMLCCAVNVLFYFTFVIWYKTFLTWAVLFDVRCFAPHIKYLIPRFCSLHPFLLSYKLTCKIRWSTWVDVVGTFCRLMLPSSPIVLCNITFS